MAWGHPGLERAFRQEGTRKDTGPRHWLVDWTRHRRGWPRPDKAGYMDSWHRSANCRRHQRHRLWDFGFPVWWHKQGNSPSNGVVERPIILVANRHFHRGRHCSGLRPVGRRPHHRSGELGGLLDGPGGRRRRGLVRRGLPFFEKECRSRAGPMPRAGFVRDLRQC